MAEKNIQAKGSVTTQFKAPGAGTPIETITEIPLEFHKFETTPAVVSIEQGVTLNLGNFESAKITVSISIPCYKEQVEEAYKFANDWVGEKLATEVADARSIKRSKNPSF